MRLLVLCFSMMLGASTNCAFSQDRSPWEKYQPRTLDQIIKLHATKVLDNPEVLMTFSDGSTAILTNDSFPSKVMVKYTGQSRTISPKRKELIKDWMTKTYGPNREELVKLFDTEFLFTEGLVEYWLPIQGPLIQPLKDELKKGEDVMLYIAWVGARKESDTIDWVFLVNEFEKR